MIFASSSFTMRLSGSGPLAIMVRVGDSIGCRAPSIQRVAGGGAGRLAYWRAGCDFPSTQQAEGGQRMIHSKRPRDSNHLAKSTVGNCFSKGES